MQKTVDGVPTNYLCDVNASLPVIITDTNSLYLYGLSLIAMQEGGDISYYHQDALGSICNLTDGSGRLTISYDYDPFGRAIYTSGTIDNPFRYTGQYLDNYIDLYYLRGWHYQAGTGRFVTAEPFEVPLVIYNAGTAHGAQDPGPSHPGILRIEWPAAFVYNPPRTC